MTHAINPRAIRPPMRSAQSGKAPGKVFIPLTDEMLYEHPERITAPLQPFTHAHPCFHWAKVEINPPPRAGELVAATTLQD